jgi:hypothetical protein
MKRQLPPTAATVRWVLVLLLLFTNCKKSADHSPIPATPKAEDKAKKYIGTYHVIENTSVYYPAGGDTTIEFAGQVIRDHSTLESILPNGLLFTDTINVISFVQSGRNPAPEWVISGREINYGSDTITFKIYNDSTRAGRDTILCAYGDLARVRILSKDSLLLSYYFGLGYITYSINQTWIKN